MTLLVCLVSLRRLPRTFNYSKITCHYTIGLPTYTYKMPYCCIPLQTQIVYIMCVASTFSCFVHKIEPLSLNYRSLVMSERVLCWSYCFGYVCSYGRHRYLLYYHVSSTNLRVTSVSIVCCCPGPTAAAASCCLMIAERIVRPVKYILYTLIHTYTCLYIHINIHIPKCIFISNIYNISESLTYKIHVNKNEKT